MSLGKKNETKEFQIELYISINMVDQYQAYVCKKRNHQNTDQRHFTCENRKRFLWLFKTKGKKLQYVCRVTYLNDTINRNYSLHFLLNRLK